MCGIAGIWGDANQAHHNMDTCSKMIGALSHRGPDFSQHQEISSGLILAHARLSIIDLSADANQPMNYRNRFSIVFNGEVFNYLELKSELEILGHEFNTQSDTEVVLAAFAQWDVASFEKFNGMWAFCIYDSLENRIILSRDRFGIKPLYYKISDGVFSFASEIQAFSTTGGDVEYDEGILENIVQGKMEHGSSRTTYLKNVYSLPAGSYSFWRFGEDLVVKKWYEFKKASVHKNEKDNIEEFKNLFFDSMRLRLRSDVVVGTCLSGGLDSSSIVSTLHEVETRGLIGASPFNHVAYHASFPDSAIDERTFAKSLCDEMDIKLDVTEISAPSPHEIEEAALSTDGPMHALAFFPIWKLYSEISKKGVKVTLDGQGPDEMLGGYITQNLFAAAVMSGVGNLSAPRLWDLHRTIGALSDENPTFSAWDDNFVFKKSREFFGAWRRGAVGREQLKHSFVDYLSEQFFVSPLPAILHQYDRCSMAHGVECRMPFMDYRLVEFVFSLSDEYKLSRGTYKWILREAMKGIIPENLRLRNSKIGFNAPFNEWMQTSLKEWTLDIINSSNFRQSRFFDGETARNAVEQKILSKSVLWQDAWNLWPKLHVTLLNS